MSKYLNEYKKCRGGELIADIDFSIGLYRNILSFIFLVNSLHQHSHTDRKSQKLSKIEGFFSYFYLKLVFCLFPSSLVKINLEVKRSVVSFQLPFVMERVYFSVLFSISFHSKFIPQLEIPSVIVMGLCSGEEVIKSLPAYGSTCADVWISESKGG